MEPVTNVLYKVWERINTVKTIPELLIPCLIAVVLSSVFATWFLVVAAIAIFGYTVYDSYHEVIEEETEETEQPETDEDETGK